MEANNVQKMREALSAWLKAYDEFVQKPNENGEYPKLPCGTLVIPPLRAAFLIDETRKALALPLRQCDVGTVLEQSKRFLDFCKKSAFCHYCPVYGQYSSRTICRFAWAQMPYEERGAE